MCDTANGLEHALTEQKSVVAHRRQTLGVGNGEN